MYQLVKGREAVPGRRHGVRLHSTSEPAGGSIPDWQPVEDAPVPWSRRFGALGAGLLLAAILAFSAWQSLSEIPESPRAASLPATTAATITAKTPAPAEASAPAPEAVPAIPATNLDAEAEKTAESSDTRETDETAVAEATPRAKAEAATEAASKTAEPPADAQAALDHADGILLHYDPERREWLQHADGKALAIPSRIVCLVPFRAKVRLKPILLTLLGGTEIQLNAASAKGPARFKLEKGLVLIEPRSVEGPVEVSFANQTIRLEAPRETKLGVERAPRPRYGQPATRIAPVTVYCPEGELAVSVGRTRKSFKGPVTLDVDSSGSVSTRESDPMPPWMTESAPPEEMKELGDRFFEAFHPNRPILAEIVAASEDDDREIRRMAISALMTLGDLSYLMPFLNRPDDPESRQDSIVAIRHYMAMGPDATAEVREQLESEFGEVTAANVEKLLIGYPRDEARDARTYQELVGFLGDEEAPVGLRELAIENLKILTGRDQMDYDPDKPEGPGLARWQALLQSGQLLRPIPGTPPAPSPTPPPPRPRPAGGTER
jgi:hypothetical protein